MKKIITGFVGFFLCFAVRADERLDAVTNRLANIIATGSYSFTVLFGKEGALEMNGFATPTSTAFRVALDGREMLRFRDGSLWLPTVGTGGVACVVFDFPVHVTTGYGKNHNASFGFGIMPRNNHVPFLLANYVGLSSRFSTLPFVERKKNGWRFCETNETGACLETVGEADPPRVQISLSKIEPDKSSIFIHDLRVSAAAPSPIAPPAGNDTPLNLRDFVVELTLCSRLVSELEHAASDGGSVENVTKAFTRILDVATSGDDGNLPPFPQTPGAARPPVLPPVPEPANQKK